MNSRFSTRLDSGALPVITFVAHPQRRGETIKRELHYEWDLCIALVNEFLAQAFGVRMQTGRIVAKNIGCFRM